MPKKCLSDAVPVYYTVPYYFQEMTSSKDNFIQNYALLSGTAFLHFLNFRIGSKKYPGWKTVINVDAIPIILFLSVWIVPYRRHYLHPIQDKEFGLSPHEWVA